MKLVSLNVWGGTLYSPLMEYLKSHAQGTDVFCFQEVFSALPGAPKESSGARMFLFQELESLLPDFVGFFEPRSIGADFDAKVDFPVSHGLAIFARKSLNIISYKGEILEQAANPEDPVEGWAKAQVITLGTGGKDFSFINFHGVAQPGNKLDTPQRLAHMEKLKLIWDSLGGENKILCGDFNLYPETQSIKTLEATGKNLIKEYKIENTRNKISWDRPGNTHQTFADFTFTSPTLKVNSFEVPYNEVSDHLPMILEFDL